MQWLCLPRLVGLLSLAVAALAAPRQLRASSSLLDVERQTGHSYAWDYNDEGQSWKDGSCANTDFSQSPVNISTTIAAMPIDQDVLFFSYPAHEAPVKMVNDGRFLYTIFPNDDGKMGGFAFGTSYPNHLSVSYEIYKMLIHTPSEHTFNGVKVPMEVQLFHRKKDAELTNGEPAPADTAIVAVGFDESRDEASPFLKSLIDGGLPDQRGGMTMDNRAYPSVLKFSDLFKPVFGASGEEAGFWDYNGGLTQPPCSGGVRWLIRQQPLNAKKPTLKYFSDVVRKSSDGALGNARELQIIGTRPVFPRFAKNAVHMKVFDPNAPSAFTEAFNRVKEHQSDFKKGLKADKAGSKEAMKDGADSSEAVYASNDYKECVSSLGQLSAEIVTAKTKQTNECNLAKGHQKTVQSIAGGPARIEAAQKGAAAQKSCDDQSKVVQAKEGQQVGLSAQCDDIKDKVQKKAQEVAAAAAEKKANP